MGAYMIGATRTLGVFVHMVSQVNQPFSHLFRVIAEPRHCIIYQELPSISVYWMSNKAILLELFA